MTSDLPAASPAVAGDAATQDPPAPVVDAPSGIGLYVALGVVWALVYVGSQLW